MEGSFLPKDNCEGNWSGRLSFLLTCGAKVLPEADVIFEEISDSLGFDHLERCFKQAISVVDNPFIPGMMLVLSLAIEEPNANENERWKLNELWEMIGVLERLLQTVQGFHV